VFAALRDALPPREVEDLLADLPDDFRPIVLDRAVMPADQIVRIAAEYAALDETQAWRATPRCSKRCRNGFPRARSTTS
jgi:hypothetical protein